MRSKVLGEFGLADVLPGLSTIVVCESVTIDGGPHGHDDEYRNEHNAIPPQHFLQCHDAAFAAASAVKFFPHRAIS